MKKTKNRSVVPIPPSYNKDQTLELNSTRSYVNFLKDNKIQTLMTTAGTSQFNYLKKKEIKDLNTCIVETFENQVIVGVPPSTTQETIKFIKDSESRLSENANRHVHFLILYNDRFYNEQTLETYFQEIRSNSSNPLYIHGNVMRKGNGGSWDYTSEFLNTLHDKEIIVGIKEESSNLNYSYNFVNKLHPGIDVIVAGGSMRRYEFLKNAGANAFLSGIGNFFPWYENEYFLKSKKTENVLKIENDIFSVFMKIGWHPSLRFALNYLGLCCHNDRQPWPKLTSEQKQKIIDKLEKYK